jgi:hypothetical protein
MSDFGTDHGAEVKRRIARWLLMLAESLFLYAYGWKRTEYPAEGENAWLSPEDHPKRHEYRLASRSHAVNSTRYYIHRRPKVRARHKDRRLR